MRLARCLQVGLFVATVTMTPLTTHAETSATQSAGIIIHAVEPVLRNEVYYLDADIDFLFGRQLLEALQKGVSLTLVLNIEIVRDRTWLWTESIASLEQRYQFGYHALTRQYMVRNLNIGTQHNYPSLEAALGALGAVADLPMIDANLLLPDNSYRGRVRARLDTSVLPVPLRLTALVSPEWRLASEWHEWRF